jgi:hypothetical protein
MEASQRTSLQKFFPAEQSLYACMWRPLAPQQPRPVLSLSSSNWQRVRTPTGCVTLFQVCVTLVTLLRYLAESEDADIKLLLQAFQLSLSCCMEHPTCKMLREQMLGRLVRGEPRGWLLG